MSNKQDIARIEYEAAVEKLTHFCETSTYLTPVIVDKEYPIRVKFFPCLSLFEDENVDENGEVNYLTVVAGMSTTVKSTLKFKMDSKLLKKLIKLAEKVGALYYHAFREQQGKRITPQRPLLKAEGGPDAEVASAICCPRCEHQITLQWGCTTIPAFCQDCGQALDQLPEPESEEPESEVTT